MNGREGKGMAHQAQSPLSSPGTYDESAFLTLP
jgi:hypothetical protein